MNYIVFDKTCKKCFKILEEVKMPKTEFEEMMQKREIGDDSNFKALCEQCS